jgi:hypothetical protein
MSTITKLLLAATTIMAVLFVILFFRTKALYDRYNAIDAKKDDLHKEVIRQNTLERVGLLLKVADLVDAKRADSLRYEHRADSMKLVVAKLKRRAYGPTRFIPVPGTPCDTAVTLRDSIITTQFSLLVEDSVYIHGLNVKFNSLVSEHVKIQRLSEEINQHWEDMYDASEKRNAEIDRKWRRKRRVERAIEIGGVVLIVIATL